MVTASIIVLGVIGIIAAILLFLAAKKFYVYEDPRIGEIEEILPGANCGGCGFSGCHAFAVECANASSLSGLNCTGVDAEGMKKIAGIVGLAAVAAQKKVAIVKCSASCENRDPRNHYDGVRSCAIESALYQGESDCIYGCLGCGDCVAACPFGAMQMEKLFRTSTSINAQDVANAWRHAPEIFASLCHIMKAALSCGLLAPIATAGRWP